MLQKNIYLFYPAGFSGTYVGWALSKCDLDLAKITVDDPVNHSNSAKLGGVGTSHLHTRIPTHQGFFHHVAWQRWNRPTDPKIYNICTYNKDIVHERIINEILYQDPNGILIRIHNDNNPIIQSFGNINAVTKWPTFLASMMSDAPWDPYNLTDNKVFRNWAVTNKENFWDAYPIRMHALNIEIKNKSQWYAVRNQKQPHEVNTDTYCVPDKQVFDRIYEFSCFDIVRPGFIPILQNILDTSGSSDNYSIDKVREFHKTYIDAQTNLKWFTSFHKWKKTGQLDEYLTSHSIVEAELIKEIFRSSGRMQYILTAEDNYRWLQYYNSNRQVDWPIECNTEHDYHFLPDSVKSKIKYQFKSNVPFVTEI
jgi:uncharacterized protein Usg